MSQIQLLEPTFTKGIRNANFVNGQLLTAEDLRSAQSANWQEHDQLGLAAGAGVVYGLDVSLATGSSATNPLVHVTAGLALNTQGEIVLMGADVDVLLVRSAAALPADGGVFAQCLPPQPDTTITNVGAYALTVMPASGYQESRPVAELGSDGVGTSCASRYIVEGVKFRLVQLDLSATSSPSALRNTATQLALALDANLNLLARSSGPQAVALQAQINADLNRLRDVVAHLCYGTDSLASFPADPFARNLGGTSPFGSYGIIDALRAQNILQPCEVPIAVLYWTVSGIQFVDRWAVRRSLVRTASSTSWPLPLSSRRLAESEAAFLHFQDQVESLVAASTQSQLASVSARKFFQFLPPCGFLPVIGNGSARGFDPAGFFAGLSPGVVTTISGAKLGKLLFDCQPGHVCEKDRQNSPRARGGPRDADGR